MISLYRIKPWFQSLLRPLVARIARAGVQPNEITAGALLVSVLFGSLILVAPTAGWPLLLLPVGLFLRLALNAIDGMLARGFDLETRLGLVLNELGDVLADAALYLPLAVVPGVPAPFVVVIVVLGIVTELAGNLGPQVSASRRHDGPFGKSDRALAFGGLALAFGLGMPPGAWADLALAVMLLLSAATIFIRVRRALAEPPPC